MSTLKTLVRETRTPIKRRKLIEVALPLEAINVASAREKSIRHGHPSTLHLWWARRPLAACRAVLFASLVDDPSSDPERFPTPKAVEDERTRLFGIIERLVLWENTTNEVVLEEARAEIRRSTGGNPPPVLDPFCGGGSIPLEAQRLGLSAHASDLNPVAVLITKALIEIPPKFANRPPVHLEARRGVGGTGAWKGAAGLAEDVRRYGAWIHDEAERRIGHLYPKVQLPKEHGGGEATAIAWLWARTVTCPNPACGGTVPLIKSPWLSLKSARRAWLEPHVDLIERSVTFRVRTGTGGPSDHSMSGSGGRCYLCGRGFSFAYIRAEGKQGRLGSVPTAVALETRGGRVYAEAGGIPPRLPAPEWEPDVAMPSRALGYRIQAYGFETFRDLFTPRQLVALSTIGDLLLEVRPRIVEAAGRGGYPVSTINLDDGGTGGEAYADAVTTYLALAFGRLVDFWSSMATWSAQPKNELVVSTFRRHSLPMTWDFSEVNPFSSSGGNLGATFQVVAKVIERLPAGEPARVEQRNAAQRPETVGMLSTDPPYYDNIGYADLSDYFYVWHRHHLSSIYPTLFSTMLTPKSEELISEPSRHDGDKERAKKHFEMGLLRVFENARRSSSDYPVTIFYAFKQAEEGEVGTPSGLASTGWESFLQSLLGAGFEVRGTWPIRTERAARSTSIGTNALASSVVLVCRPRPDVDEITTRKDFIFALKRELPEAIRTLQHGNVAPVDLAQASIGPGMAVFSRYVKVLEPDGSPMPVRTALALINQALDELLTEQEGEFDADTRWAIAWYEQFGLRDAEYGTAETLSKAKNSSVTGLVEAGIVAAARGRVRLLAWDEYGADWDPTTDARVPVWEAMQRLIRALLVDGEIGAAALLARIGGIGDVARDLAYRLYHVAERKGWTEEARAYNALVVAWPDLVRGAEQARTRQPAQASLGLET